MDIEEHKLKIQRDLNAVVESAYENGLKAGRLAVENGTAVSRPPETLAERLARRITTAKKLKEFGISTSIIIKITKLSSAVIEKL